MDSWIALSGFSHVWTYHLPFFRPFMKPLALQVGYGITISRSYVCLTAPRKEVDAAVLVRMAV